MTTQILNTFTKFTFKKKYKTLFDNTIKSIEFQKINFIIPQFEEDLIHQAYQIKLSPSEVENIAAYADTLAFYKERTYLAKAGKEISYQDKKDKYKQGFVGEYAFAKLMLYLEYNVSWDDRLIPYGKGDKGDLIYKRKKL